MNEEQIIELGCWAERLLHDDDLFRLAVEQFDQQCFQHFMSTSPKDKMEREGIYQQWQGAKDFLAHLAAYVEQKDIALQQIQIKALSQEDAQGDIDISD